MGARQQHAGHLQAAPTGGPVRLHGGRAPGRKGGTDSQRHGGRHPGICGAQRGVERGAGGRGSYPEAGAGGAASGQHAAEERRPHRSLLPVSGRRDPAGGCGAQDRKGRVHRGHAGIPGQRRHREACAGAV